MRDDDPSTTRASAPRRTTRWIAAGGILLLGLNLRAVATVVSPFYSQLGRALGAGTVQLGLLGSLPTLCFAVGAVVAWTVAGRLRPEMIATIALALGGAAMLARSIAGDYTVFAMSSAIALTALGMGNVIGPVLIVKWGGREATVLVTGYASAMQVSTVAPILLALPFLQGAGWRFALAGWGALALVSATPWIVLAIGWRARRPVVPLRPRTGDRVRASRLSQLSVSLLFGMSSLITYTLFVWLAPLLTHAGHSPAEATALVGVLTAAGFVTAFTVPAIARSSRMLWPLTIVLVALYVIGLVLLAVAPGAAALAAVICIGLGIGSYPLAVSLVTVLARNDREGARLSGQGQSVGYLIASVGPWGFGVVYAALGSASATVLLLLPAVALLGVGGTIAARIRRRTSGSAELQSIAPDGVVSSPAGCDEADRPAAR